MAEDNGEVVAYIALGTPHKEMQGFDSEVFAIYSSPDYFNSGAGKLLFDEGLAYLKGNNFKRLFCCCLEKNNLGRKFYERMGGKFLPEHSVSFKYDGKTFTEVLYAWELEEF